MLKNGINILSISKFSDEDEKLAMGFYQEIRKKQSYDIGDRNAEWETVDMSSLKNRSLKTKISIYTTYLPTNMCHFTVKNL
jgi:hypothetical protein